MKAAKLILSSLVGMKASTAIFMLFFLYFDKIQTNEMMVAFNVGLGAIVATTIAGLIAIGSVCTNDRY